jgi:hypothetical protein
MVSLKCVSRFIISLFIYSFFLKKKKKKKKFKGKERNERIEKGSSRTKDHRYRFE